MTIQEGYGTFENWMSRLSASTQIAQGSYFQIFMRWVKQKGGKFSEYTPDQLIEYQKQTSNGSQYDILDVLAQPYVRQAEGTFNTKRVRYSNIRSFFAHNRAELPKDPNFKIRPDRQPIYGELLPDEIKKNILASNKAYQAAFMVMFQSAMDQEMFSYWNMNGYDNLMAQLNSHELIIKIELPGRKANKNIKPFYTFFGKDGIDAVRNWLKDRPEDAKAIITDQFGGPIQKASLQHYWLRHLRVLGLAPPITKTKRNRTGKSLHEMRDTFRTLWSKSPADHKVGEYCMGHSIDPLNYDKSFRDVEYYKDEYMKAVPYLNLLSSGAAFGRVEKGEVDKLRVEVQRLEIEKNNDLADMKVQLARLAKLVEEKASK